ncbi:MAG: TonB-dependent receptor [Bacteroidales bacterium]|nr:TonB-dependent receptor [Bacteroidales bacterium]
MKKIINIFILLLAFTSAFAQTSVKGSVKDKNGAPVPGAVVMLAGHTDVVCISSVNGDWVLNLPSSVKEPVLTVSCLGYAQAEVAVNKRTNIDIVMEEDAMALDEVIVVGYGSMRKSDITGSVSSVRIDEDLASRSTSISSLLQGNASGVQVLSNNAGPDAGVSIRIRGLNSFNSSSEPLYVVDGVVLTPVTASESLMNIGADSSGGDESVNGLMGINPQDIESMEVLKDASATAIYGSMGANGVVLITTKGARKDKPTITFSAGMDITTRYKKMDILGFDDYVSFLKAQDEAGSTTAMKYLSAIYEIPSTLSGLKVQPVDWQDYCFRTAVSQRYHFTISGRPKTIAYSLSLGYSDKEGIVKNSGVEQYTVRLNLDKNIAKKIKIGTKVNFAYVDSRLTQGVGIKNTAASSLMRSILTYRPYRSARDGEEEEETDDDSEASSKAGPDKWLSDFLNTRKEYRLTPNLFVEYKPVKWMTFKSSFGADYRDRQRMKFKSSRINTSAEASLGAKGSYTNLNWNWDNTLNFNHKYHKHNFSGVAGVSTNSSLVRNQIVQGWNIEQYRGLDAAISTAPNSNQQYVFTKYMLLSFIARAVYNYDDRYLITATYRADGSSKFQGSNKWGHFPSFAFAWRLSEEPWFHVRDISQAKLRLGWGCVGNQSIPSYQTTSNYNSVRVPDHTPGNISESSIGIVPSNLANPNLKWETGEQFNGGVDLSFWKGRLALNVDCYYKITRDLLQAKNIATSTGFSSMWVNEGCILNYGTEIQLDAVPVKSRNIEWTLGANLSINRNRVAGISDTADRKKVWITPERQEDVVYFYGSAPGSGNYATYIANIFMEGYPMGLFYGLKTDGIVQQGETGPALAQGDAPAGPGSIKYLDLNGNGYIDDEDRTIIGDPNPSFTFGLSTTFSYRNLSFSMAINGSYGNDIYNVNNCRDTDTRYSNHNVRREAFTDAWSPSNPGAKYYGIRQISVQETRYTKDRDIEDGSYMRLSDVSVAYKLPLKKQSFLKGLRLSVSASNLLLLTRYSGWDPDVNSFGTDISRMGCDLGSYPGGRTFSLNAKFTF